MRRIKARNKQEKCKYKRCMSKRVENARYCAKHMDKMGFFMPANARIEVRNDIPTGTMYLLNEDHMRIEPQLQAVEKLSLWQRIKSLFYRG